METNENMDGAMGFDELPLEGQLEFMAIKKRLMETKPGETRTFLDRSFNRRETLEMMRSLDDEKMLVQICVIEAENAERFYAEKPAGIYAEWAHEFDLLRHLLKEKGLPCMRAGVRAVMAAMNYDFDRAMLIARKSKVGEEKIAPIVDYYRRNV